MASIRANFTCGRVGAPRRPCARAVSAGAVVAEPASVPIRSADGSESGSASVSLKVANDATARHVVHRYMLTAQASTRQGSANTKTRSEVRGGGRKPYQQKGTGRARQGSTRTPLRPGGGVTFGPKPKDWSIDMNKKEKKVAMATALQSAACDMVVLDSLPSMEDRKTKSMVGLCSNLGVDVMSEKALFILAAENEDVQLAGRNIAKLKLNTADCLRVTDVLGADKIIIEQAALDTITTKFA